MIINYPSYFYKRGNDFQTFIFHSILYGKIRPDFAQPDPKYTKSSPKSHLKLTDLKLNFRCVHIVILICGKTHMVDNSTGHINTLIQIVVFIFEVDSFANQRNGHKEKNHQEK